MKKYLVYNAGFIEEKKIIYALSPMDAAQVFFADNKYRDPIVVKWGFWGSKLVRFEDLKSMIQGLDESNYDYRPMSEEQKEQVKRNNAKMRWLWKDTIQ